jgi:predicted alpha/beta-hydrolase family hydrolase
MQEVPVLIGSHHLPGALAVPAGARALVLFAHGSGSSRRSPRNQHVADVLQAHGLATLLFDLLSQKEGLRWLFAHRRRCSSRQKRSRAYGRFPGRGASCIA